MKIYDGGSHKRNIIIVLMIITLDSVAVLTQYGYHLTNPNAPLPHGGVYHGLTPLGIVLFICLIILVGFLIKLIKKYRTIVKIKDDLNED